ncbi:hypothetical protein DFO83_11182 [Idiomarina loihiensis]|jgi:hypothetical protein|uniref:hypothetical protein n=1 Tax=Idiomarina TaxID=135575 RepID=UPI000D7183E9|nr:hypothetical protein [Idiomarina]PWW34555.1 hypothetical protein DFO83_11182 [Idiomarina loihiensis]TDP47685.1 hypothetical protein DET58_105297 [Idiomarina loihiensis]TDS23426.1 hypothetical protein DET62_105297 [Idiomarina sp. H2]
MAKIVRDDGSWVPDPSGATSGDLQAWRERMYQECPNPNAGDIVIVLHAQQGKRTGYRALNSEGYDTRWQRVSTEEIEKHLRLIDVKDGGDSLTNPDDYVYLADGVYVHKDDAWF